MPTPTEKRVAKALAELGIGCDFRAVVPTIEPLATVLEHLANIAEDDGDPDNSYWIDQARYYTQPAPRTEQVHIRITTLEKAELQRLAEDAGQTMSDYARARIFGSDS